MRRISIYIGLILCFSHLSIKAQETKMIFKLDNEGLKINSEKVDLPVELNILEKIIGSPDRVFKGANTIFTWDELGLICYQPKGKTIVNTISIIFVKGEFDFSPKKTYHGNFIVQGGDISIETGKKDLSSLGFEADWEDDTWWDFRIKNIGLIAVLKEDYSCLESLDINYEND